MRPRREQPEMSGIEAAHERCRWQLQGSVSRYRSEQRMVVGDAQRKPPKGGFCGRIE